MLTISFEVIVILMLIGFITGLIAGISIARQGVDIDVDEKLAGDPTTNAPKPDDKKKPKGK
jgi:hypothetical protein